MKPTHFDFQFDIGDTVRYSLPTARRKDAFAAGNVVAREIYEDGNGTRMWVYVRWFCGDGKPDAVAMQHSQHELERLE